MAKVRFGQGVAEIRGSIGGSVFSINAQGAYIRNRSGVANRDTTAQQAVRAMFGQIATEWRGLSSAEQLTWEMQVSNYPKVNALGEAIYLSPHQLFFAQNNSLMQANAGTLLTTLPSPVTLPGFDALSIGLLSVGGTAIQVAISYQGTNIPNVPSNTVFVLESTGAMSTGVYRPKSNRFRQIGTLNDGGVFLATNFFSGYVAKFGAPVVGQQIMLRGVLVSKLTGQRTPVMQSVTVQWA